MSPTTVVLSAMTVGDMPNRSASLRLGSSLMCISGRLLRLQ